MRIVHIALLFAVGFYLGLIADVGLAQAGRVSDEVPTEPRHELPSE